MYKIEIEKCTYWTCQLHKLKKSEKGWTYEYIATIVADNYQQLLKDIAVKGWVDLMNKS